MRALITPNTVSKSITRSRFVLSRAGAIAAVAASSRLHRVLPMTARLTLLVGGATFIGIGAALTMATGLGPGPFDVLVTGIASLVGLPFAVSLWLMAGALGLVAAVLGKRPGIGTALAPLIIGPTISTLRGPLGALLDSFLSALFGPSEFSGVAQLASLVLLSAAHLGGVVIIGLGAGAMITSGLGAGTGDLLAAATSSKLGRSVPVVRTALEISFVGVGMALGGAAGVGTVLVALTVGPAVRFGHDQVNRTLTRWSHSVLSVSGPDTLVGRSVMHLKQPR